MILRWARQLFLILLVPIVFLLAPVAHNELMCQGQREPIPFNSVLPAEHHRPAVRTLLTYPEWHIVNAYDDYAKVIETGDPHDYAFLPSVAGFWGSLCTLTRESSRLSGDTAATMQMVYVIGVSFTAEWLMKATYEETLGRAATWLRGSDRATLDDVSAKQAREYANFLQQVPWYKWGFVGANEQLSKANSGGFRNWERRFALGLENAFKAMYAGAIAKAVAGVGADQLTLRMKVRNVPNDVLEQLDGVKIVLITPEGTIIETPRYRALTHLIAELAQQGAHIVEIAGNDMIMVSILMKKNERDDLTLIYAHPRQGYGDVRQLHLMPVQPLGFILRDLSDQYRIEHIFDY